MSILKFSLLYVLPIVIWLICGIVVSVLRIRYKTEIGLAEYLLAWGMLMLLMIERMVNVL